MRRPRSPVELFRLVLFLAAGAPLALSGLLLLTAPGPPAVSRIAGGIALLALAWWWLRGYRRGRFPEAGLVLEAVALTTLAVGVGGPNRILWLFYAGVWFRALDGPGPGRLLTACSFSASYLAAVAGSSVVGPVASGTRGPSCRSWAFLPRRASCMCSRWASTVCTGPRCGSARFSRSGSGTRPFTIR